MLTRGSTKDIQIEISKIFISLSKDPKNRTDIRQTGSAKSLLRNLASANDEIQQQQITHSLQLLLTDSQETQKEVGELVRPFSGVLFSKNFLGISCARCIVV